MLCSAISASADSPFALGVRTKWLGTRVFTGLDIGWSRTPEERMRGRAIEEKYIMETIRRCSNTEGSQDSQQDRFDGGPRREGLGVS